MMNGDELMLHFENMGYKVENQSGVVMIMANEKDFNNRKKFEKIVKGLDYKGSWGLKKIVND